MSGEILEDLAAEQSALDHVVAGLDEASLALSTPSPGYTVRHQIAHLAFFERQGVRAVVEPDVFTDEVAELGTGPTLMARAEHHGDDLTGAELVEDWRAACLRLIDELRSVVPGTRIPWYGPSMSVASFATARLMETWAHGLDIVDALRDAGVAVQRPAGDQLRHVCHIGVASRPFCMERRGLDHAVPVRVTLALPSGAAWSAGPDDAVDTITGSAADFCAVVAQRRHVTDTALVVTGSDAAAWMEVAQCFAGPVTEPPAPGTRPLRSA